MPRSRRVTCTVLVREGDPSEIHLHGTRHHITEAIYALPTGERWLFDHDQIGELAALRPEQAPAWLDAHAERIEP